MLTNVNKRCNGKHKSHLTAYLHANNNFLLLLRIIVAVDTHASFFVILTVTFEFVWVIIAGLMTAVANVLISPVFFCIKGSYYMNVFVIQ